MQDSGKPNGSITYYTNYSNGVMLSPLHYEYWQKQPITAVITCRDVTTNNESGEKDGSHCACASTLS